MTPGSCALCPGRYKSQLYGGLCQGLRDLSAPSFPFSRPDHRTIFRRGDHRGGGGKRGGGADFPIIPDSGKKPKQWDDNGARRGRWTKSRKFGLKCFVPTVQLC